MFYNYESEDFIEQVEAKIKYGFITLNNNKQMTGIELITKEREEQITKHNYSVESDKNNNTEYQLVDAVNILIIPEENMEVFRANSSLYCPIGWSIEKRGDDWRASPLDREWRSRSLPSCSSSPPSLL